jgi:hypothetical protein
MHCHFSNIRSNSDEKENIVFLNEKKNHFYPVNKLGKAPESTVGNLDK